MRIGLDCDGVISDWAQRANSLLSLYKGYKGLEHPHPTYDYLRDLISREDWRWLWTEGVENYGLFYTLPYAHAIEDVKELAKIGDVILITRVPKGKGRSQRLIWLGDKGLQVKEVHFLDKDESKSSIKCDIYIEDNIIEARELNSWRDCYLLTRRHNQDEDYSYKLRLDSLSEFVDICNGMSKQRNLFQNPV